MVGHGSKCPHLQRQHWLPVLARVPCSAGARSAARHSSSALFLLADSPRAKSEQSARKPRLLTCSAELLLLPRHAEAPLAASQHVQRPSQPGPDSTKDQHGEKKRKDYAFQRQYDEKPSITPGSAWICFHAPSKISNQALGCWTNKFRTARCSTTVQTRSQFVSFFISYAVSLQNLKSSAICISVCAVVVHACTAVAYNQIDIMMSQFRAGESGYLSSSQALLILCISEALVSVLHLHL